MSNVWITSISSASAHGVFAIESPPPAQIQAIGTGTVAMVGQFPWGPDAEIHVIDAVMPRGVEQTAAIKHLMTPGE